MVCAQWTYLKSGFQELNSVSPASKEGQYYFVLGQSWKDTRSRFSRNYYTLFMILEVGNLFLPLQYKRNLHQVAINFLEMSAMFFTKNNVQVGL